MENEILKVDLPRYVTFFLNILIKKLRCCGYLDTKPETSAKGAGSSQTIKIKTKTMPHCYDGIELIKKTLVRKNINCSLMKYEKMEDGFYYEFLLSKRKNKIINI